MIRLPDNRLRAVAGSSQLIVDSEVELQGRDKTTFAEFSISEGEEVAFSIRWARSFSVVPNSPDVRRKVAHVTQAWRDWSSRYKRNDQYSDAVLRSLITLKALTYSQSGGMRRPEQPFYRSKSGVSAIGTIDFAGSAMLPSRCTH